MATRIIVTALLAAMTAACGGPDVPRPAAGGGGIHEGDTSHGVAPAQTAAPTRSAPAGGPARSREPGSGRASAQPEPGRPEPASPGIYRFRTEGTTQVAEGPARPLPETTTLRIERAAASIQRSTRDLRDEDGTGAIVEQTLAYRPDGVHLTVLRLRTDFAGVTRTYDLEASGPSLVFGANAAPGDRRRIRLAGDGVAIETVATIERRGRARVEGRDRDVFVMRLSSTFTGDLEGTQIALNTVDPASSLTVREDVRSDVRQGAVRVRSVYIADLVSDTPE